MWDFDEKTHLQNFEWEENLLIWRRTREQHTGFAKTSTSNVYCRSFELCDVNIDWNCSLLGGEFSIIIKRWKGYLIRFCGVSQNFEVGGQVCSFIIKEVQMSAIYRKTETLKGPCCQRWYNNTECDTCMCVSESSFELENEQRPKQHFVLSSTWNPGVSGLMCSYIFNFGRNRCVASCAIDSDSIALKVYNFHSE